VGRETPQYYSFSHSLWLSISSSPFQHHTVILFLPRTNTYQRNNHTLKHQRACATSHTPSHHSLAYNNATPPANPTAGLRNRNTHSHPRQSNNTPNQRRPQCTQWHPPPPSGRAFRTQRHPLGGRCRRQRGHGQEEQQSMLHLP